MYIEHTLIDMLAGALCKYRTPRPQPVQNLAI